MAREWNDLQETELDIDETALLQAIIDKNPNRAITTPGADGAVVSYNGHEYETWHDVAYAFGVSVADFAR